MRVGSADAQPDEIDWNRIVENWDLPFPKKIKPSCTNPCTQKELDEIAAGQRPGLGSSGQPTLDQLAEKTAIKNLRKVGNKKDEKSA